MSPTTSRGPADLDVRPKQSPAYNRGMMLESTEEIDYSLDSAKDLKPPYSYATMIGQAILASDEEKLTLNNIYTWIMDKYAFYRHSQSGWQVRERAAIFLIADHHPELHPAQPVVEQSLREDSSANRRTG